MGVISRIVKAGTKSEGKRAVYRSVEDDWTRAVPGSADDIGEQARRYRSGGMSRREFIKQSGKRAAESQAKKPVAEALRKGGTLTGIYEVLSVQSMVTAIAFLEGLNLVDPNNVTAPSELLIAGVGLVVEGYSRLQKVIQNGSS